MLFNPTVNRDPCIWWLFSVGAVHSLLTAVGFSRITTTYHRQLLRPEFAPWGPTTAEQFKGPTVMARLFTIVAERD